MRAVYSSQGSILVRDIDIPSGDGELISVTSAGICGSDLHLIQSGLSGIVLGHEFGGYTQDGRLVAVRPTGHCGSCNQCLRGHTNTCRSAVSSLHGTSIDGGLAEFVLVEKERIYLIPEKTNSAAVALIEPLAVVVHGTRRVPLAPGMRALVVGAGSIGLLTAAVLIDMGLEVDIVCRYPHQRSVAEAIGAVVCDPPGKNYNVSFDAVCTQESFDICLGATEPGGNLVEFGMIWEPITLSNSMMLREISVIPSIFYSHHQSQGDFEEAINVLARHPDLASHIVTHRFPLSEAVEAFATASDRHSGAIKVHLFSDT